MMTKRKKRRLIAALILMNVVLSGLFVAHVFEERRIKPFACASVREKPSRDEARKCFAERMNKVGAEMTSSDFEVWNKKYDLIQQHFYAHEFGAVLYKHEGTPGLKFCSMNFAYGCFHELIAEAIRAEGIGIVDMLNDSCRKNLGTHALGCQHGIGHGIQSVLGYEEKDFLKTLSICRSLPYNDPISGCYGGAVMEYNLRTILSVEGGDVRPMITGKEDLCAPLEKEYLATCYYQLPQWWYRVLRDKGYGEDKAFLQVGDWCRKAVKDGRERCFRGIGNITPSNAMTNYERPISICKAISAGNHDDFKYCVEDVANSFTVEPSARKNIPHICGVLAGKEVQECMDRVMYDPKLDMKE